MNIIHLLYMDNVKGLKDIMKQYENLTYFDQYGGSVISLVIITLILLLLCLYCYVIINIEPIKNNWATERCKMYNIPFAGFINKPSNMSFNDFTIQNFNFCSQQILSSITGTMVEPITYITNVISNSLNEMSSSINSIRAVFDKLRTFFETIVKEIMGRLMNIMIPLQQIIISMKDVIGKVQGTMTASLFTLLGSYYALKSLMGAIAQLIIIILIALAVTIAILWILPFTWGAAISMTAVFVAISIPMIIIIVFLVDVLKVQTSLSVPTLSIPSVKCFDKNTLIEMNDGTKKKIININIGDKLMYNNEVTAKIKVETTGSYMYNLNGVIVSDSHFVKYLNNWINVSSHPQAIKISSYTEPYLYCLNTKQKIIYINEILFSDWDEVFEDDILNLKINKEDINKKLDGGFFGKTLISLKKGTNKAIKDILIGDILENGEKIYGVVEINGKDLVNQYEYYLGKNVFIQGSPNLIIDNEKNNFISTINLDNIHKKIINKKEDKLYHLLTDKKSFYIEGIKFHHYNASIDIFLAKNKTKILSVNYV